MAKDENIIFKKSVYTKNRLDNMIMSSRRKQHEIIFKLTSTIALTLTQRRKKWRRPFDLQLKSEVKSKFCNKYHAKDSFYAAFSY